jgi:hypothetical protein
VRRGEVRVGGSANRADLFDTFSITVSQGRSKRFERVLVVVVSSEFEESGIAIVPAKDPPRVPEVSIDR